MDTMLARVITLRFDPMTGSFDDGPLRDFIKDKEVLSIRDYFFVKHEVPYLVVLVTYAVHRPAPTVPAVEPRDQRDTSWRTLVTEEELPLFNALRDWRAERSKHEGVPPYVICTNRQFAAMVKTRPQSLPQLADIEGVGKAKLEKYGQEILAILTRPATHHHPHGTPPAREEIDDDSSHAS